MTDVDMHGAEEPQRSDLESRTPRAFPKSADSSWLDNSPFRPIPKASSSPLARQDGPDEDPTPPTQRNPSRSASRAPSRSSRRSRSSSSAVHHPQVVPGDPGRHSPPKSASRASSVASGPYGVISAVAVPAPSVPAPSEPSRASSVSSRRPRSRSLSRAASAAASTVIDPLNPFIPTSPDPILDGPSPVRSRSQSVIPDSSIDRPGERPVELHPQGGPLYGPMGRQRDERGRFTKRPPARNTWNPDDAHGDTQPGTSTDPPRDRSTTRAKAKPKARGARRAQSTEGIPTPEEGARPKAKARAKPRARSSDNVRAPSTQYTPEDNPQQPSRRLRAKTPAPEGYELSRDPKVPPTSKAQLSHPSKEPKKKGGSAKNTIEEIIEASNLPPGKQALLPKHRLTTKVARPKKGRKKKGGGLEPILEHHDIKDNPYYMKPPRPTHVK